MNAFNLKSVLLGSAAFLAAATGSAMAADLGPYQPYNPPPEPAPLYQPAIWDGAYMGINGGYGWSTAESSEPQGGFGGGQIGYNWQRGRIVFGLEGDIQGSDISGHAYILGGDARSDINWFSTVRGRLGFASGPWLLYATGGLAVAGADNTVHIVHNPTYRNDDTLVGYSVGGGLEWKFSQNWSAKAEYLYLGLGDSTLYNSNNDTVRINNDVHTIRVGLNYHF